MKSPAIYSLLCLLLLHAVYSQISFIGPVETLETLPTSLGGIQALTLLDFNLLPLTLHQENYTSTWTLPNGEMVSMENQSPNNNILVIQGRIPINATTNGPSTSLLVHGLSYTDAGVYRCSVQDDRNPGSPPIEGTIELRLTLTLTAINSSVTILDNASFVELRCDMSNYIRPDDQLQWFRDGEMITSGKDRRQITFMNGNANQGQFGDLSTQSSRVSMLTISNPILSDTGTYNCRVIGTTESVDIELLVQSSESTFPLPALIGGIAGILALIVLILVIVIVVVSIKRRKMGKLPSHVNDFEENGAYASTSNGGSHNGSMAIIPNYAKIDKFSPPPLPARPSTNLSMSGANSVNSFEPDPPDYATPDLPHRTENYDPYYDDPQQLKAEASKKFFAPSPRKSTSKKTYYDDVDIVVGPSSVPDPNPYDMSTVPSPADILNGSMPRINTASNRSPDFSYPIYNAGIPISDLNTDHDYDQIYSEPIDPTLIRSDFEFDAGSQEAIPYSAIYEDPLPLQEGVAPLLVTHDNIQEVKNLGMGQFGNVILSRTIGLSLKDMKLSETDNDRNISILVATKRLKLNPENGMTENFNKEVKFMARLMHDNVIRLLGVCHGAESFIMMEYMENGDLNQFLQKQQLMPDTISGLQENEVTPIILLYIGVQIASGMHYLASHRFVHRDLATRNCLVGKDFVVKISDFGMSRSLYESAYYRVQGTLVLPIRWMACETFYGKFSVKSDAWAFGVVLWEIYTLGKVDPYDHMTDEEVIADAIRGPDRVLPIQSKRCPQEVYDIMLRCWVHEPSMRADFGEIYSRLFMIYTRQAL
ncbi:class II receptor tyrosine kinase-like isoform X3 [Halichondria panicea]|uniref:class II receptor tyrosine kinase-like isoform X3 n=1 Tax=Halichondria panicea TaxID=6063 RepID=UPI00312B85B8